MDLVPLILPLAAIGATVCYGIYFLYRRRHDKKTLPC